MENIERKQEVNKYNIGDELFFMYNNTVHFRKTVSIFSDTNSIKYRFEGIAESIWQNDCYKTKEELLASL